MIPWFKCTPFELRAIVALPPAIRKRFIAAREKQLARELETLPDFTESERIDLDLRGIETELENMCGRILSDRKRKTRTKSTEPEESARAPHVPRTFPARAIPPLVEREDRETEREREAPREREHELPDEWKPTAEHAARAKAKHLDIDTEADSFRHHALSHARKATRWNAAFTTWLIKAKPGAVEETTEEFFTRRGIPRYVPRTA